MPFADLGAPGAVQRFPQPRLGEGPRAKATRKFCILGAVYWNTTREEEPIKVHCHLCGATLRAPEQYQRLDGPAQRDAVYVCRDERRCQLRAGRDPLTGERHPSSPQPRDPTAYLAGDEAPWPPSRRS